MMANNGTYYLFYSANNYESYSYASGYAACSSPLGPCTKVRTRVTRCFYTAREGAGIAHIPFDQSHLGRQSCRSMAQCMVLEVRRYEPIHANDAAGSINR